jgi:hypothetical protein
MNRLRFRFELKTEKNRTESDLQTLVTRTRTRQSMSVSRQHRSRHDPFYAKKMQSALEGLHSGRYRNVKQAAEKEKVSSCFYLTSRLLFTTNFRCHVQH